MPAGAVGVSVAAARCCHQLGLARRFSSALSLPSALKATASNGSSQPYTTAAAAAAAQQPPKPSLLSSTAIPATATASFVDSNSSHLRVHNAGAATATGDLFLLVPRRTMATSNRKAIDAKNAKRLKIQQKKKKNANKAASGADDGTESTDEASSGSNPFLQHQEWVRFQQSITVDGFQTGQTTTATVLKKSRGGKQARRKREQELAAAGGGGAASATGSVSAVAQKFPAIRYSPEETEDLLRQAYEALPPRDGKRGHRNLRRQETRWRRVRKNRSDAKAQKINAHFDKMEKRQNKRDRTKEALSSADAQRADDLAYQGKLLQRWRDVTMAGAEANR